MRSECIAAPSSAWWRRWRPTTDQRMFKHRGHCSTHKILGCQRCLELKRILRAMRRALRPVSFSPVFLGYVLWHHEVGRLRAKRGTGSVHHTHVNVWDPNRMRALA